MSIFVKLSPCTECTVVIKWTTRKIKTLFSLKSKNPYPSYKIYEGTCSCGSSYIGETKRNTEVRWNEHNDHRGKSEPAKHLYNNPSHKFSWRVILSASKNARVRRNLEASVVALKMPDLNNQVDSKKLTLFRYGVTQNFSIFPFNLVCRFVCVFKLLSVSFYSTEDDITIEKLLQSLF